MIATAPGPIVRKAGRHDAAALLGLIRALAAHEGFSSYVRTDEDTLRRHGFGERPAFAAFIAELDGAPVGFVSYTVQYSIWYGREYLHVDDVFVAAAARGAGVGKRLMAAVARECLARGYAFARWTVETGNARAIGFYRGLGAGVREKGVCTWTPEAMAALATGAA
ncbi:GNAT family N-acetyltransferase [Vulcaniibacterium tengchongense]|uniref:Acetyltransferase (GNAT) family protein n=1 Tax=Vulcaniibacterium tengchongense TaxID=1273429 RepID=A0A3N4W4K3_9GAMM|nr:GNAT family N-acetyltransferase [Vulcaniibacterium tengchongense]RPE80154.1 acetyltransferase (GNAT) family protein [Vulcaniibacterium tengchongense]